MASSASFNRRSSARHCLHRRQTAIATIQSKKHLNLRTIHQQAITNDMVPDFLNIGVGTSITLNRQTSKALPACEIIDLTSLVRSFFWKCLLCLTIQYLRTALQQCRWQLKKVFGE